MWDQLEATIQGHDTRSKDVPEVLASIGSPSTSIAVLDHGNIDAKSYSTIGSDTETVYQCCSISKPIAGMAIMKLVQQGKIDLDASMTKYLPASIINSMATPDTQELLKHITVKQLMSHTSGLTVHGFGGYIKDPPDAATILTGQAPANTLQVRLGAFPGQRHSYSGGAITVLQLILEHVCNKSFPELMDELVFKPLDMRRSFYKSPTKTDNFAPAYATGYQPLEVEYHTQPEMAAAGLWTTPTDLLKAIRAMQQSLSPQSTDNFLNQETARLMLTKVIDGTGTGNPALTWFLPGDEGIMLQHGGSNWGYRCHIFGYIDLHKTGARNIPEGCGICVMTNSDEGSHSHMKMIWAITHLKQWPDLPDSSYFTTTALGLPEQKPSAAWTEWKGHWGNDWTLDERDGSPYVIFRDLLPIRLVPMARPQVGEDIGFVLKGLDLELRLSTRDGERVLELRDGKENKRTVLRLS